MFYKWPYKTKAFVNLGITGNVFSEMSKDFTYMRINF